MIRPHPVAVVFLLLWARPALACGSMGGPAYGFFLLMLVAAPVLAGLAGLWLLVKLLAWVFPAPRRPAVLAGTRAPRMCDACRLGRPSFVRTARGWECTHRRDRRADATSANRPPPARREAPSPVTVVAIETAHTARCPVCRAGVTRGALACGRCAVPHHADCFEYNGGCAIYGCA